MVVSRGAFSVVMRSFMTLPQKSKVTREVFNAKTQRRKGKAVSKAFWAVL
jgi:hypothetical protein